MLPEKITLQPFSLLCTCASTLYIGKRLKRFYLMFAAVFRLRCMFAAAYLIRFQLSRLFLNKV
nr:MAG TPA: hypothetical protein [Caudoviricetes sp.]